LGGIQVILGNGRAQAWARVAEIKRVVFYYKEPLQPVGKIRIVQHLTKGLGAKVGMMARFSQEVGLLWGWSSGEGFEPHREGIPIGLSIIRPWGEG